jgi:hypothetical protein
MDRASDFEINEMGENGFFGGICANPLDEDNKKLSTEYLKSIVSTLVAPTYTR